MNKLSLVNNFLCTDVVSVRFFRSFVLAGVGGILKVLEFKHNVCRAEVEVFKGHKIYGIQIYNDTYILVHGSKSVKVFEFLDVLDGISLLLVASVTLNDWVLAAHWLGDGTQAVLVTAHNVVWLWSIFCGSTSSPLKESLCSEKCILYSASICGLDWTNIVVFAGTVFREIVVWIPGSASGGDHPVLHRLVGHSGVIFSVTWDQESSFLCSTSDDRSVRLWHVSFSEEANWKSSLISCTHVLYGHSARVWRCLFSQNIIISVGEDSRICFWSSQGNLLDTIERISSGSQWSVDCSAEHQLLVTGAGDGSIQLFPIPLGFNAPQVESVSYPQTFNQSGGSCSIRKITLIAVDQIVVVMDDGNILSYTPSSQSWNSFKKDSRFASYCILSASPDRSRFSLASLKGLVVIHKGTFLDSKNWAVEQQVEDGKIWSLLWLSNEAILVCGNNGRLSVWEISENSESKLTCIGRFKLPSARERWPTAALLVLKNSQKFILCGDRCGSLHLFKLPNSEEYEKCTDPKDSLSKTHGKLGVTSISLLGNQILSTGRDGTVKNICVDCESERLIVLSSDKMMMDWVCRALHFENCFKNFIMGFKETKMVLWSTQEQRNILQLECGGGHRSWDCNLFSSGKLEIVFVRENQIQFSSWPVNELMKPTLQNGISAKELNCAAILCKSPPILLLGGEDGAVFVSKFSGDLSKLLKKLALTTHISSVRCVCLHEKFFFSAGGRAQLKAWQVELGPDKEFECMELASHMLKGERHPRSSFSIDPEMRYMSICSIPFAANSSNVKLVAGCSDGALRWLTYDSVTKSFLVVGESMFHRKCVLKVHTISFLNGKVILISTATDGTVAVWNVVPEMFYESHIHREPLWSCQFHQSGVNSVHAIALLDEDKTTFLLASGGDDNSVNLSVLAVQQEEVKLTSKWMCNSAHAAQVTGVWLVEKWLLSTSIDQRLTIWRWTFNQDRSCQIKCDFIDQTILAVPDIHDMQIFQTSNSLHVCVVGKGVQIVTFNFNEPGNLFPF